MHQIRHLLRPPSHTNGAKPWTREAHLPPRPRMSKGHSHLPGPKQTAALRSTQPPHPADDETRIRNRKPLGRALRSRCNKGMSAPRLAAIDVGTNSVKLLVVEAGPHLQPILETGIQTRLGEGFYPARRLQPQAIARTVEAVRQLVERARSLGATRFRLFATSAAREAANRQELRESLENATGLPLEIISGLQEAEWAYLGVRSHPGMARGMVTVVEVGGGSTQLVWGRDLQILLSLSLPWGAVRLWELSKLSDPPGPTQLGDLRRNLRQEIETHLVPAFRQVLSSAAVSPDEGRQPEAVAVGGTALTLARIHLRAESWDREALEHLRLTREELKALVDRLAALPLAERRQLPGLPPERADIILTGGLIYEQITETLGLDAWRFSTRGLRYGALLSLLNDRPPRSPETCADTTLRHD